MAKTKTQEVKICIFCGGNIYPDEDFVSNGDDYYHECCANGCSRCK